MTSIMFKSFLPSLFFLAAVIGLAGCTTHAQNSDNEVATTVFGARATSVTYRPTVFATGALASAEAARLSFKTGGIIARIHVREGQEVRQGQLLAELALDEIGAQVRQADLGEDQARIQLENARLALQLAERDYRNVKALFQDSVATLEQYENVQVQLDNARNQLEAAEKGLAYSNSNVEIAQFNLRYSKIVAPTDGVILRQFAEVNELVGPGTPVFYFGSTRQAQVLKVAVTDKDIVHLNLGDTARVTFDAYPEETFTAYVRELAAHADPYTGTFAVELALAEGVPTKTHVINLLHRLIDGKTIGGPDLDTPQALVLRREPEANVERYDGLRMQIAGGRHAS